MQKRRDFLKTLTLGSGVLLVTPTLLSSFKSITENILSSRIDVSFQVFPWTLYLDRQNSTEWKNSVANFKLLNTSYTASNNRTVFRSAEGFLEINELSQTDINTSVTNLTKNISAAGLIMKSAYTDIEIHNSISGQANADLVIYAAKQAKKANIGFEILVFNPAPKDWDNIELQKTAGELATQVSQLSRIVSALKIIGVTVSLHHHEAPVKINSNIPKVSSTTTEIEYMLEQITDLTLCLEPTWLHRGLGANKTATNNKLTQLIKTYGTRISEIHIRQSSNNVFKETFSNISDTDDIDYSNIVTLFSDLLANNSITELPHLVLEQFFDDGAKNAYPTATDAQTANLNAVKGVFCK